MWQELLHWGDAKRRLRKIRKKKSGKRYGLNVVDKRFVLKLIVYAENTLLLIVGSGYRLDDEAWRDHVKAIQIKALLDYRNATRSQ